MQTTSRVLLRLTIVWLLLSLPLPAGIALTTVTPESTQTPLPFLEVAFTVTPAAAAPGDNVTYSLVVTNIGAETVNNVVATAYLPTDLAVQLPLPPEIQMTGQTLTATWPALLPGLAASVSFSTELVGLPEGVLDTTITVTADELDEPASATASLLAIAPPPEAATIPDEGGSFTSTDERVDIAFPPEWTEGDTEVTYTPLEWHEVDNEDGVALGFELEAFALGAGGPLTPVTTFSQPLTVTIAVSGLLDLATLDATDDLYWAYRDSGDEAAEWRYVSDLVVDAAAGTVTAQLDHFSEHNIGAGAGNGWRFLYNDPTVSLFNGGLAYQYPIALPPGPNGLQPNVTLTYNSSRLDGLTSWTQSDWVGLGWSLDGIEITRKYVQLCEGGTADDVCWGNSQINPNGAEPYMLTINGSTYDLEPAINGQEHGRYITTEFTSLFVKLCNDTNATVDLTCINAGGAAPTSHTSGEYWVVLTKDGTQYRLGYTPDSEQITGPKSTLSPWSARYTGRNSNRLVYRWRVDRIEDVYDNRISFTYEEVSDSTKDKASYPKYIYYGETAPDDGDWLYRVHFNRVARSAYYDSPTCGDWTEDSAPHLFHQNDTLRSIQVQRWTGSLYTTFSEYELDYWCWDKPGGFDDRVLKGIEHYGLNGVSGGVKVPATVFSYLELPNRNADCTPDPTSRARPYRRMTQIDNGYGGIVTVVYEKDSNRETCDEENPENWDWYNYHVKTKTTADGTGRSAVTEYIYSTPCYGTKDNPDYSWCNVALNGPLVGFSQTTVKVKDYNNTILSQVDHYFRTEQYLSGREYKTEFKDAAGTSVLHKTEKTWLDGVTPCVETGLPEPDKLHFVCLASESTTYYQGATSRTTTKTYQYDPANQSNAGGIQYGQVTLIEEKDHNNTTLRRHFYRYAVNTTNWVIVRWAEAVFSGGAVWDIYAQTHYLYDGNLDPDSQSITIGKLTLQRQVLATPGESCTSQVIDDPSVDTSYTYNPHGNVTTMTTYAGYGQVNCSGGFWSNGSAAGNGSAARVNTTTYDARGIMPTNQQNALGHDVSTTYATNFPWFPITVKDEENTITTEYRYDSFARLTKVIRPGDSETNPTIQTIYYDDSETDATFDIPLTIETKYRNTLQADGRQYYDGLGRLLQTQTASAEVSGVVQDILVTYDYDARGLTKCQTAPYGEPLGTGNSHAYRDHLSTCDTRDRTKSTYDALGRVWQVFAPDGTATTTTYNVPGSWTTQVGRGFRQEYVTNANGDISLYTYDALGRLDWVGQKDDGGWCSALHVTTYDYDPADRLTQVTRGGYVCGSTYTAGTTVTSMSYDTLGRKVEMDDPDMGQNWLYTYNPAGNLTSQKDARLNQICFTYDVLNRPLARFKDATPTDACPTSWPLADQLAAYTYDTAVKGVGQLASVSWGSNPAANKDTFTYESSRGRLASQTRLVDGRSYVLSYQYDALDRVTATTYPGGEVVNSGFNAQGLAETLIGSSSYVANVVYNARSQLTLLDRPGGAPDTSYTYYPATGANGESNFRLQTMTASSLLNLTYTYDLVGNVAEINNSLNNDQQDFTYDHLGRLLTASGSVPSYSETYDYSNDGQQQLENIHTITRSGSTTTYTYGNTDHKHAVTALSGGTTASFGYDANGNMTSRTEGGVLYNQNFDVENRLTSVVTGEQTTTFVYDAAGQRVKTIKADGTVIYTPFPHYEEELRPQPITIDSSGPATGDAPGWTMTTTDAPSWNYGSSDTSGWTYTTGNTPNWGWTQTGDLTWTTTRTFAGTAAFSATEHRLGNLAKGTVTSQPIIVPTDDWYRLTVWVKGELKAAAAAGEARIEARDAESGSSTTIWSSSNLNNNNWQQVQGDFWAKPGTTQVEIVITADQMNGWLAVDDITLAEMPGEFGCPCIGYPVVDAGFESGGVGLNVWSRAADANYPATSLWYGNDGPAVPAHGGNHSLILSNLGHSEVTSSFIPVSAASQQVSVWARGEMDSAASSGKVRVLVDYYNSSGVQVGSTSPIWEASSYNQAAWQQLTNTSSRPTGATQLKVRLVNHYTNGWIDFDDLTVTDGATIHSFNFDGAMAGWQESPHVSFPASVIWRGGAGYSSGAAYTLGNEAYGARTSAALTMGGNQPVEIKALLRGELNSLAGYGNARVRACFSNAAGASTCSDVWSSSNHASESWSSVSQTITSPADTVNLKVYWEVERINGWVEFDDLSLTLRSAAISSGPNQAYDLVSLVRGVLSAPAGQGGGKIQVDFYNSSGGSAGTPVVIWNSTSYAQTSGQPQSGTFTTPTATATFKVSLELHADNGWLAFDTITLTGWSAAVGSGGNQAYDVSALVSGSVSAPMGEVGGRMVVSYSGSSPSTAEWWSSGATYNSSGGTSQSSTFVTPAGTTSFKLGMAVQLDNGWLGFDAILLTAKSGTISSSGGQVYDFSALVSGQVVAGMGQGGRILVIYSGGTTEELWASPTNFNNAVGTTVTRPFTTPTGTTSFHFKYEIRLDNGWLAYDTIRLTGWSAPIVSGGNEGYDLAVLVRGNVAAPLGEGGKVTAHYSGGTPTPVTLWSSPVNYNSPGGTSPSSTFTTPTGTTSFKLAFEVRLDNGWLGFDTILLTGKSQTISAGGGQVYDLSALVSGSVVAPLGEGGAIKVHYTGGTPTPATLWSSPANYNSASGTTQTAQFTTPAGTTSFYIAYEVRLDNGKLTYNNIALKRLSPPAAPITRKYYSLGGQTIALYVNGDPEPTKNGLFYIYTDHLGSTTRLSTSTGSAVLGSDAYYLPFGGYRVTPTAGITDRGFTGHAHNDPLGLVYMQARYYLPSAGRFVSADTIVPEPVNPQAFNRYSYVNNNPLKYTDPTGHCPAPGNGSGGIICVAFFIPTARAIHLMGDNRDFSSDSDPSQSRAYFYINVDDGSLVGAVVNPTHNIFGKESAPDKSNSFSTAFNPETGEITLNFQLTHSGFLSGISPSIDGQVRFRPDGNGSYESTGRRDAFPNVEAYYYEDGNLQDTIFQLEARISETAYDRGWTTAGPLNLISLAADQVWLYSEDMQAALISLQAYNNLPLADGFPQSYSIIE